ncbi:hypothetical protein [Rummeliibacillus sp. SL167]|uniref:hypothetical protein n=1 Tax=Rummeliibacillus sp. SL167 TaxID=2579792 RepID=UPI0011B4B7D8|nr:hypothetical protein [Rummeliibacillus sp. SL167]
MKYKKSFILVSMIVLLIVGILVIANYKKTSKFNDATLSINDLKHQNFLNHQQAVLYASSTTEVLQKEKGNSQVIFIDRRGHARGLTLSGLESGSTYFHTKGLFMEESDRVMMLDGSGLNTYDMPSEELRGIQTGYLTTTKQFYSLYNTGFSKKDDYVSTIRYGGKKGIHSAHIPYFISTAGQLSDSLMIVTQDLISGEFALQKVELTPKVKTRKLLDLSLEKTEELDAITPVVADDQNYYFIMSHYQAENREDLQLVVVNRDTKKVKNVPFIQYRSKYQVENGLPFNFNHSAYVNDGHFYYVNGLGEVYEYHVAAGDIQKILQLSHIEKGNSRFEQITFQNNQIHHIYSNEKQRFYLETYDLSLKKSTNTVEIQNLDRLLPMGDKNYFLTSLEVLK